MSSTLSSAPRRSTRAQTIGLAIWLVVVFCTGAIGAIASREAPTFYAQLVKPSWAPPGAVFGPVWSTLYLLMGIAAWLVWRQSSDKRPLALFFIQLLVNGLWSWLFFVWHRGALAFVDAFVLAVLIAATIAMFWRIRRLAAVLLIPYLCWVSFACVLTWSVWRANPTLLE